MTPLDAMTDAPRLPQADWTRGLERSLLRQLVDIVARPGVLSFAGGLPAAELFPAAAYAEALAEVLAEDPWALQYSPVHGPFRHHVAGLMALRGTQVEPESLVVTTGAQQALQVIASLLLNRGGQVMLEPAIYTGIQQAVAPLEPRLLTVPSDLRTGIDVDAVEAHLAGGARPAFLYVIPDGHNPLGVRLSLEKRRRLADLARRYHLPLVEDDPYGFLTYGAPDGGPATDSLPPLHALAPEWVFYVGSFSKIIAPGLRLGWLAPPEAARARAAIIKESLDLETSGLTQRAVARFMDRGHLPAHIERLRATYRDRRDRMLAALERHFPPEARWSRPHAGMFVWIELPRGVDTLALLEVAVAREAIAYVPGQAFAVRGHDAAHCLRLSFSNCQPDRIEDGIRRLARVFS